MNRTFVCVETTDYFTRAMERVAADEGDRLLFVSARAEPPAGVPSLRLDVRDDPQRVAADIAAACEGRPAVAAFTNQEPYVIATAAVAGALGVGRNPVASAGAARDKARMKEIWQAAGVSTPRGTHFTSRAGLDLAQVAYPAIVKPTHGFASCGVRRVESEAELLEQVRKIALLNATTMAQDGVPAAGFLVEQCLEGREYSVDTVWFDGRPAADFLLANNSEQVSSGQYFPDRLYALEPSMPEELRRAVIDLTHDAVRALGISHGPTHTEVRFHDGTPYVLETAARPGAGGIFYDLAHRARGADLMRAMYLSLVCDGREEFDRRTGPALRRPQAAGPEADTHGDTTYFWFNVPHRGSGIIRAIEGLDELRERDEVLLCVCFKEPGHHLHPDGDLISDYFCNIMGRHREVPGGPSLTELLKSFEESIEIVY
ncbi:ATP-grasp domain-containing protein [Kitasatospora sp. RG8]|uniref:ATP-grasp domain-containing protein n=1 Tax=Kitasatospora sp. RG8 TaxID=2820815 RepID=UPI001ADF7399|nr:ATP-grasp domain-containing protein [Kitasatospora sp. RG8]MBP0448390.1 ATP-grasp domain-containing protein [Kitasatospora sp. RG8]